MTQEELKQIIIENKINKHGTSALPNSIDENQFNLETINRIIPFIKKYFVTEVKTINKHHTNYGLKHLFERLIGSIYISNGEFTVAMIYCGFDFKVIDIPMNCNFNISEKDCKVIDKIVNQHV